MLSWTEQGNKARRHPGKGNEWARIYSRNLCCLHHWMDGSDRPGDMIARTWARTTPNHVCRPAGAVQLPVQMRMSEPSPRTTHKRVRARLILMPPLLRLAGHGRRRCKRAQTQRGGSLLPRARRRRTTGGGRARLRGKTCVIMQADRSTKQMNMHGSSRHASIG